MGTRRRLRYRNRDICGVFSLKGYFSERLRNGCSLLARALGHAKRNRRTPDGLLISPIRRRRSLTSRRRTAGPTNSPSHKQAAASSSSLLAACRAARERMDSNGTKCTRSAAKFFSKFNPTCQGRAHPLEASPIQRSGGGVMLVMATVCCQPGAACLPREANIPSYIRTYKRTSKRDSPPSCAASPVLTAHEALHRGHSMACVSFARAPYLIPARSSAEKAIFRGLPCLDASSTCRALALRPPRQRSPICL